MDRSVQVLMDGSVLRQPIIAIWRSPSDRRNCEPSPGWETFKTHAETVVKLDNSISRRPRKSAARRVSGIKSTLKAFPDEAKESGTASDSRTTTFVSQLPLIGFVFSFVREKSTPSPRPRIYLSAQSRNALPWREKRILQQENWRKLNWRGSAETNGRH